MKHGKLIYFVRAYESGLIKIGITTDYVRRLASLERQTKQDIVPLFIFRGDEVMEAQLHRRFRRHLAQGREWFWPDPDLMCFIRWAWRWDWTRGDQLKRAILEAQFSEGGSYAYECTVDGDFSFLCSSSRISERFPIIQEEHTIRSTVDCGYTNNHEGL